MEMADRVAVDAVRVDSEVRRQREEPGDMMQHMDRRRAVRNIRAVMYPVDGVHIRAEAAAGIMAAEQVYMAVVVAVVPHILQTSPGR